MKSIIIFLLIFTSIFAINRLLGVELFIITSDSMTPLISKNDLVIVKPEKKYRTNDVISYKLNNNSDLIITHRIVDIKETLSGFAYSTKGDANKHLDKDLSANR